MKSNDGVYNRLIEIFSGMTDREQLEVLQLASDLIHGNKESNPIYQQYLESSRAD